MDKLTLDALPECDLFGRRPPKAPPPPPGMALREVDYTVPPSEDRRRVRREADQVRRDFLRMLARRHRKALRQVGITNEEISEMLTDGYVPHGFSVHHRMPVGGGGDNSFANFILIRDKPHHESIHAYLEPQLTGIAEGETRRVTLPWPEGHVFVPPNPDLADMFNRQAASERRRRERLMAPAPDDGGPGAPRLGI